MCVRVYISDIYTCIYVTLTLNLSSNTQVHIDLLHFVTIVQFFKKRWKYSLHLQIKLVRKNEAIARLASAPRTQSFLLDALERS